MPCILFPLILLFQFGMSTIASRSSSTIVTWSPPHHFRCTVSQFGSRFTASNRNRSHLSACDPHTETCFMCHPKIQSNRFESIMHSHLNTANSLQTQTTGYKFVPQRTDKSYINHATNKTDHKKAEIQQEMNDRGEAAKTEAEPRVVQWEQDEVGCQRPEIDAKEREEADKHSTASACDPRTETCSICHPKIHSHLNTTNSPQTLQTTAYPNLQANHWMGKSYINHTTNKTMIAAVKPPKSKQNHNVCNGIRNKMSWRLNEPRLMAKNAKKQTNNASMNGKRNTRESKASHHPIIPPMRQANHPILHSMRQVCHHMSHPFYQVIRQV
eukprot:980796_1